MCQFNTLIVDDVPANLFSLSEIIKKNNINIYEASSGEECLWSLLKNDIDIVIMDINMPNMDGYETANFIHNVNKTKNIPIIFVTASNKDIDIDMKCYKSGGIDIIYKPINKEILRSKIDMICEMIAAKKQLEEQVKELEKLNEKNKEMQEQIRILATTDFLTNIANRRKIDIYCKNLIGYKLSMLMIDLDDFKMYNDNFGHQKGDIVLKEIVDAIKLSLDDNEFLGRYGGEEFLVIIKKPNVFFAMEIAKKIIQNTLNKQILRHSTCKSKYLTVSIGISNGYVKNTSDIDNLINFADKALYQAKKQGKNCYQIYKEETTS